MMTETLVNKNTFLPNSLDARADLHRSVHFRGNASYGIVGLESRRSLALSSRGLSPKNRLNSRLNWEGLE